MRAITRLSPVLLTSASLFALAQPAFAADADTAGDATIIVTGKRETITARSEQKAAINLVNVQAAEDIVKYPDFNAAEALGRIPGVSLAIDTGEGRFVNIRGIDGNLNGTTFGGVTLLNTQPGGTYFGGGGRAVELDTIPIGAVDRLVVRKTGLPDQDAEGLGGSVELTPRTAQGLKGPFVDGQLGGGYQSFRNSFKTFVGELAAGTRFGPDQAFGIVLHGSYHSDFRSFDDIEPGYLDDGVSPVNALDSIDLRRYNYHRRRFGFGGELSWDPTPQSHYYVRANNAGYVESVNRQILQYRNLGDLPDGADPASLVDPNNAAGFFSPLARARSTLRDEQETHLNFVTSAGGRNDLGKVIVDYQVAYTTATYHRAYDRNSTFRQSGTFPVAYDNQSNIFIPSIAPIGFNPNDPSQFTLSAFRNATERAHDREVSGVINVTIPTELFGAEDASFKFGGKLRFRDKIDTPRNFSYSVPAVPLTSLLGPGPFTNFYGGRYSVGFSPDAAKIRSFFNANPALFTQNVDADLQRDAGGFFNDTENVYAGYGQYQGTFGKLTVLAGLRIENTDGTYRGTSVITADNGSVAFVPTSQKKSYTDFFPTVQLRYKITPDFIARATYSTGIGRPGFLQLNSGASVDVGGQAVSVGNPNLKPITSNAFDATLEYYLPNAGIVSIGFFDKELNDYILQRIVRDPNYPGISGITTVSTYSNINHAYARGLEASYVQKFSFLPAPFDGLGFTGNVTYVDSRIEIRPGEFSKLPGTSKLTYNAGLFYEGHGAQVRLSLSHVGSAIFGVGSGTGLDVFQDARTQVDITASYEVFKNVALYFEGRNLNNSPLRYYEGSANRQIQREFYEQSYEAGVRFHF